MRSPEGSKYSPEGSKYTKAFDHVIEELRDVTDGLAEDIALIERKDQVWLSNNGYLPGYFCGYKLRKESGRWRSTEKQIGVMALHDGHRMLVPRYGKEFFREYFCLERITVWQNNHEIVVLSSRYKSGKSRAEWDLSQSLDYTLAEIDQLREEILEISLRPPDRGGILYESACEHFENAIDKATGIEYKT